MVFSLAIIFPARRKGMPAIAEPRGIPTNVKIQPIFCNRAAIGFFLNSSPFNKEIDLSPQSSPLLAAHPERWAKLIGYGNLL